MHPLPLAVILAAAATAASALQVILARWRDLSALPVALGAAAICADGAIALGLIPAAVGVVAGIARGAGRGVSRPETTALSLLFGTAGAAVAHGVPGVSVAAIEVALCGFGAVGAGWAATRRSSVRTRATFVGEVPIRGPARTAGPPPT